MKLQLTKINASLVAILFTETFFTETIFFTVFVTELPCPKTNEPIRPFEHYVLLNSKLIYH